LIYGTLTEGESHSKRGQGAEDEVEEKENPVDG